MRECWLLSECQVSTDTEITDGERRTVHQSFVRPIAAYDNQYIAQLRQMALTKIVEDHAPASSRRRKEGYLQVMEKLKAEIQKSSHGYPCELVGTQISWTITPVPLHTSEERG